MAFVAETVGAQPIDFKSATGEVIKGATEAAGLYAAQQKAEATKIELENMKVKQDSMKAGIFLDYMDKIKNSPNPAVKKVLMKQYGAQHQKMYGGPMDENTLKAISDSPDFGQTLDGLIQNMGIEGAGKEYANMINKLASSLGLPYVDAEKTMKQAFDYYIEEKKAQEAARLATMRQEGAQGRFDQTKIVDVVKFEQSESKDIENKREKLTALDRNMTLIQKGKNIKNLTADEQRVFDDSLVTAYTKMQDPTSVVMPSEYQRTMSTLPEVDKLETYLSKQFKKGGLLEPAQRQVMINYLDGFTKDQVQRFNQYVDNTAKRVAKVGGDPSTIQSQMFKLMEGPRFNQGQQSILNTYLTRKVPYSVFAQKNPVTAKSLGEAEYNKMLMQKQAGK